MVLNTHVSVESCALQIAALRAPEFAETEARGEMRARVAERVRPALRATEATKEVDVTVASARPRRPERHGARAPSAGGGARGAGPAGVGRGVPLDALWEFQRALARLAQSRLLRLASLA